MWCTWSQRRTVLSLTSFSDIGFMAPSQQVNWEAMCTSASFSRHVHPTKWCIVNLCARVASISLHIMESEMMGNGFITCLLANGNQRVDMYSCVGVDHHVGFVKWWIEKFICIQREKWRVCVTYTFLSSLPLPESGLEYILPRFIHLWRSMVMCVCIVSSPACPLPDSTTAPLSLTFSQVPSSLPPLCMPPVGPSSPRLQLFAYMPFPPCSLEHSVSFHLCSPVPGHNM